MWKRIVVTCTSVLLWMPTTIQACVISDDVIGGAGRTYLNNHCASRVGQSILTGEHCCFDCQQTATHRYTAECSADGTFQPGDAAKCDTSSTFNYGPIASLLCSAIAASPLAPPSPPPLPTRPSSPPRRSAPPSSGYSSRANRFSSAEEMCSRSRRETRADRECGGHDEEHAWRELWGRRRAAVVICKDLFFWGRHGKRERPRKRRRQRKGGSWG